MKSISSKTGLMGVRMIRKQGITHPFGDHRSVNQAFPAGINSQASDPFLMCDYFAMAEKTGPVKDPDEFPVNWHPHRGFDIASYLKSGTGRHGDSLGNRETYETPGMQWMSTGSGVEHAEGGATEKGVFVQGFQIWINVPSQHKMDDPKYGTVPTQDLPLVQLLNDNDDDKPTATARVLAGDLFQTKGPFATVQPVEMVDLELEPNAIIEFDVGSNMDTAMIYVYQGKLQDLNEKGGVEEGYIALMDADDTTKRAIRLQASNDVLDEDENGKPIKVGVMLFAGKKLKEEIAWHGPIVMNTQIEVRETLMELRTGQFPPTRVPWDYHHLSAFPHAEEKGEL